MYYIRFADLLTDADLCEMSVPFSVDRRIVQPGAFSCSMDVANSLYGKRIQSIVPGKTVAHVYRNNMIVGSYIVWTKALSSASGKIKCDLQGATLESYLYRRRLSVDLSYSAVDQMTIASDLIGYAQAGIAGYTASGDLGISVSSTPSGVLRDRTYAGSDGKMVGDLLEELANVDDGFEYVIHVDSDTRDRVLTLGYPRIHSSANPFVIEEPGTISSWKVNYDSSSGSTAFWTRGSVSNDEASGPIVSDPFLAQAFLESGWPLLENITDYANVSEMTTLNLYAKWWADNRSGPVFTSTFNISGEQAFRQGFHPGLLGSDFIFMLCNPAFPLEGGVPTMSGKDRMIGFKLDVDNLGGAEIEILVETSFDTTDVV